MGRYFRSDSASMNKIAIAMEKTQAKEKDELGQYPIIEREVCRFFCAVVPQTGSLLTGRVADTAISKTTHKIKARYRRGINDSMWLVVDGEIYDIMYILDPYLEHKRLEIFCEVRGNGSKSGI